MMKMKRNDVFFQANISVWKKKKKKKKESEEASWRKRKKEAIISTLAQAEVDRHQRGMQRRNRRKPFQKDKSDVATAQDRRALSATRWKILMKKKAWRRVEKCMATYKREEERRRA